MIHQTDQGMFSPIQQLCGISLAFEFEDWRIRRRLKRVERRLRAHDVSAMPCALQLARMRHLDHLRDYWRRGRFPRNTDRSFSRVPCFIDRDGRTCAVAELMMASGRASLATCIDQAAHNARVRDMQLPELGVWIEQSGLTVDELAMIQPGYDPAALLFWVDIFLVPLALVITLISIVIVRLNRGNLRTNRTGWRLLTPAIVGLIGSLVSAAVLITATRVVVQMVLYFFGLVKTGDIGPGLAPASQTQMALPLLVLLIAYLLSGLMTGWVVLSGLRVLRSGLGRESSEFPGR